MSVRLAASLTLMVSVSALVLPAESLAQDTIPAPATTNTAIIDYEATFFDQFAPVTALDMVNRLPGFSLNNGDTQRRGLADAFGNLLIDGARPSDKSIDLGTVLSRIPADQVLTIQLIREPVPEYEMRGHNQLANVILRESSGMASAFNARLNYFDGQRLGAYVEGSVTRSFGGVEVTAALARNWRGPRVLREDRDFDGNGVPIQEAFDSEQRTFTEWEPSLSILAPLGENTRLRVNASGEFWDWNRRQRTEVFAPTRDTAPLTRFEVLDTRNGGWFASATATLDHNFSDTLASQTVLLVSREEDDNKPETFTVFDPNVLIGQTVVDFNGEGEETALRQTFNWTLNDSHSVEFGAEAAFNASDNALAVSELSGGVLVPVDIPVASTRVEERRGELSTRHVWGLSETLSLESGLRYEFSEISQSGDAEQERTFSYLKPSVNLTWRPTDQRRWRFALERNVDQLNFGSFASTVDLTSDQIDVGNPDYRPQTDWTLEAQVEQRLGEDGSVTLTAGRVWVQNLDDAIAVTDINGNVFDAPGNIGDGTLDRITLEWTSPLDRIGLRNATLDGFVEWYNTNVTDPVSGLDRAWSGIREWELRFDFRQTFPESQMAWGWDYFWLSEGAVYRAREFRELTFPAGDFDLYVETTRWFGLTTRLGADFIFDTPEEVRRTFFTGSRADGIIARVRETEASQGVTGYLQVRGAF